MGNREYKRQWISTEELVQASILLRDALAAYEDAIEASKKQKGRLAVGFKPSFLRGISAIQTFTAELRTSAGMSRAGMPFTLSVEPRATKTTKKKKGSAQR